MNESMKTTEVARDSSRNYTKTTGAVSGEGEETWRRAKMETTVPRKANPPSRNKKQTL